jgi:hypothetical protein
MPVLNRIQIRRGTLSSGANQWGNEVLYAGEIGYETDTGKFKIGDGITAWGSLPYASILPSELSELVQDIIGTNVVAGSGINVSYNDSNGNTTVSLSSPTITVSSITDFSEGVMDVAGSGIISGSNINISYNDNDSTITVAATGLSLSGHTHLLSAITDITASATELNYLDGSVPGSGVANTAVVLDGNKDIQGIRNLTLTGDLTVNGTTTTVNSTTVSVDDKNLELGSTISPRDSTADGGGITLKGTSDKEWKWLDSTDSWTSSEHINLGSGTLTYKLNGTTVIGNNYLGASGYALASGVLIDGGTP